MGTARRRRAVRRLSVALMLVAAAASDGAAWSSLSLSDFEQITSGVVSVECLRVYDSQIAYCTVDDFEHGNACSPGCMYGLQTVQTEIQTVCTGFSVPENSILGQAFLTNLVGTLCPGQVAVVAPVLPGSSSSSSSSSSTASHRTSSTRQAPSPTSTRSSQPVLPAPSSPRITSSAVPRASSTVTGLRPSTTSAPVGQSATPTSRVPVDESGGGSPIDVAPERSGSRDNSTVGGVAFAFAVAMAVLLLLPLF